MNSEIIRVKNPSGESVRLRWYKAVLIKGDHVKRQRIIGEIKNIITDKKLSEHILFMYMENTRNSSSDCYIFILIKSKEHGKFPQEVKDLLVKQLCNKVYHFDVNLGENQDLRYYDQILAFLEKKRKFPIENLKIYNFGITIPYLPVVSHDDLNPFNLRSEGSTAIANSVPPENYDHLLYLISSLGSGSWESFRSACNMLQIPDPKRLLRRFKLLGHIETSADGSRWSGTAIALLSVNDSEPNSHEFILCGQRSLELLDILESSVYIDHIEYLEQPQRDAPLCIRIHLASNSESINQLVEVLRDRNIPIQNEGDASLKLAKALPTWKEWMQSLPHISAPKLGYDYEYYDVDKKGFIQASFANITGMYQLKHQKLLQFPPRVCFFDKTNDRWLQGDWYGLRFLALQHYNQNNQTLNAHYDRETASLYIPWSQRWSEIYERALVLASGCLPNEVKTNFGRTLQYHGIQAEVAELLTSKLNINLHQGKPECMTY